MKNYILWEKAPAKRFVDAYLLGNGRLGMSVMGGAPMEDIQINDDTLWSGSENFYLNPQHYDRLMEAREHVLKGDSKTANNIINEDMEGRWFETYLPLASLHMTIGQPNNRRNMPLKQIIEPEWKPFEDYRRELDLTSAVSSVSYTLRGIRYTREYFVSKPQDAGFIYCTAQRIGENGENCAEDLTGEALSAAAKTQGTPDGTKIGKKAGRFAGSACLDFAFALDSQLHSLGSTDGGEAYLTGIAPDHAEPSYTAITPRQIYKKPEESDAIRFACCARVIACDGTVWSDGARVYVNDATYALIAVKAGTNYAGFRQERNRDAGVLLEKLRGELDALQAAEMPGAAEQMQAAEMLEAVEQVQAVGEACVNAENSASINVLYELLKAAHITDYQSLYGRMDLDLGHDYTKALPTSERLQLCKSGVDDAAVSALLLQYTRYLTIAGSRPGSQAMNLQGIWNDTTEPPWSSNYTNNINVQMNYWPCESLGLPECHLPLMDLVEELSIAGRQTAQGYYHMGGWVTHHNADLWRSTEPSCEDASWSWWPFGGAWICEHIWTHYEYTKDTEFLRRMYPVLREAAVFMLDFLTENEDGYLVTAPSLSPENKFITGGPEVVEELVEEIATGSRCSPNHPNICAVTMGSTMDMSILRELFSNVAQAAEILNIQDDPVPAQAMEAVKHFPSYRTGRYGQLLEWYDDYEECTPGMGHISHMYPVYPGNLITETGTPELMEAAKRSLERRLLHNSEHGAWPAAWKISLMARFKNSLCCGQLLKQTGAGFGANMFTATHQQIDAIFGVGAGIAEMLLQSHQGFIEIIPAITVDWADGSFRGMRARGGFEVSAAWKTGKLYDAKITSLTGGTCRVKAEGLREFWAGDTLIAVQGSDLSGGIFEFETCRGCEYRLVFR